MLRKKKNNADKEYDFKGSGKRLLEAEKKKKREGKD